MSEWILCDVEKVVELGRDPKEVEGKVLDLLLAHKLSSPNAVVDIGSPQQSSLAVGLSGDRAYVEFGSMDGEPPYFRVINPSPALGKEPDIVFSYKGQRTPLPARNCLSVDDMIRIVKHFLETESIPGWLKLEEV